MEGSEVVNVSEENRSFIKENGYKPNTILLLLNSLLNFVGGNKSNKDQTKLVNGIIDKIYDMTEEEFKERVKVNNYKMSLKSEDGSGKIEIWWCNEYYSCGNINGYSGSGSLGINYNSFPDMKTRFRLINLKKRIMKYESSNRLTTLFKQFKI